MWQRLPGGRAAGLRPVRVDQNRSIDCIQVLPGGDFGRGSAASDRRSIGDTKVSSRSQL